MRKIIYSKPSPLSRFLEWLVTIALVVWLVRILLCYLKQHVGILIAIGVIAVTILGGIIAFRIIDYHRRIRF